LSITKVALTPVEIEALVRAAFGNSARVVSATSADSGMFNAGYHLSVGGAAPAKAFLKVAPPEGIAVLTYEHGMMRAEVDILGTLSEAGVGRAPKVLATDFSRAIVGRDCFFMEHIEGQLLKELRSKLPRADLLKLRKEIGHIAGTVGAVNVPRFGYPGVPSLQATSWPDAFARMFTALLDDAERFDAPLPMERQEIAQRVRAARPLLDNTEAALVHFDLWDSNVLVAQDADGWSVRSVIDWERAFYGDPLAELVALTLFEDAAERDAAGQGFEEARGHALASDERAAKRLALYRAYLWLIMIVEAKPRGLSGSILLPTSAAAGRFVRDMAMATK